MGQHSAKPTKLAAIGGTLVIALGLTFAFVSTDPGKDLYDFVKTRVFDAGGPTIVLDRNPDHIMGLPLGEYFYTFPLVTAATLPAPADEKFLCEGMWQWAHEHGGQDSRMTRFAFTVQANTKNVQVNDVELHVAEQPPGNPAAEIMTCPMGDPTSGRFLSVDLDAKRAEFTTYPGADSPGNVEAAPFGLTISPGESERVLVIASGTRNYRWHMTFHMIVGGEATQFVLTDENNRPFITMGPSQAEPWGWTGFRWVP